MPRTSPSSDSSRLAVETVGLGRVYKTRSETVTALDSVDLKIREGELFGVLGPNGAGKTTLIKILVTLLLPTSGTARVDGFDVVTEYRRLRPRISIVSGGENAGYGILKVREQLWMFSQFYGMPSGPARARIDELLERLGLADVANRQISGLSSGMRQKMNLVRGLMTDPRVLFLDEPTVALDVGAARDLRQEVGRWMEEDPTRTVILTTHYMQEADDLCDRIAIVNKGRIVIEGTPHSLKAEVQRDVVVDLQLEPGTPLLDRLREVEGVGAASVREEDGIDRFSLLLVDDGVLTNVISTVERSGRRVAGLAKRQPTLEDAFVKLVGRSMSEEEAN
ncbi:MAG: ABC transporter ATP-binding protein [Chloroflexi bacterium]|nr:MAG: ABC transporter ATP-binding protein [Chloroflexota bacterium]TMD54228.1 MAG: ABC transporter ATP-binding protein [Chloroflexota bacterium]